MATKYKTDPPGVKKREEAQGKDLDGDSERGESPAHRAKVLGGKGKGKGKKEIPSGGLKKGASGAKPCKKCGGSHVPPHPHFK